MPIGRIVGLGAAADFHHGLLGVDFDNTPIAPIVVTDVDGVRHRFEIRSMLVGTGHAMYAREVRKRGVRGGYRFEILGDFETDARNLFELLRERIRQGLSVRHVEKTEHGWQLTQALRHCGGQRDHGRRVRIGSTR